MKNSRRNFLKAFGTIGASIGLAPQLSANELKNISLLDSISSAPSTQTDESFWRWVQQSYTTSATLTNLNNGGVSPQPKVVQDAFERYNRLANEAPSYYMWRVLDKGRESLRQKLAGLAGVDAEEIVINRNTTEALETIIFGLPLKKGDEVVLSPFDYPNMKQGWVQRQMREGIVIKWVELPMPIENDEIIVEAYKKQITSKTKLVHITHMINWTGQVLPAKKIANAAHEAGAEVLVDGAHSFAHLDFTIPETGADYFGTSLHKWLCAPFGTGMMYIKKEKIAKIWPSLAPPNPQEDNIRKFEAQGTRSFPAEYAIGQAIDFHKTIGVNRKAKRLHFLKNYWLEKALENPKIKSFTSLKAEYSGAIATIAIEGKTKNEVSQALMNKYQIHTTSVEIEDVSGVRITPHIYTTLDELDKLVVALNEIAQ